MDAVLTTDCQKAEEEGRRPDGSLSQRSGESGGGGGRGDWGVSGQMLKVF